MKRSASQDFGDALAGLGCSRCWGNSRHLLAHSQRQCTAVCSGR